MLLLALLALFAVLVALLCHEHRCRIQAEQAADRARAAQWRAEREAQQHLARLHSIAESAQRGHPLVKWRHHDPARGIDIVFLRARFEGVEHFFEPDEIRRARIRGEFHLGRARGVAEPTAAAPAQCSPANPATYRNEVRNAASEAPAEPAAPAQPPSRL